MHPKFCSNCGAKLNPDAAFCPNCGAKVKMLDTSAKSDDRGKSNAESNTEQTIKAPKNSVKSAVALFKNGEKQKKRKIILLSAIVVALAIIVLAIVQANTSKLSDVVSGSIYHYTATEKYEGESSSQGSGYIVFSTDGKYAFPLTKEDAMRFKSKSFDSAYEKAFGPDDKSTYSVDDKNNIIRVHDWLPGPGTGKNGHGRFIVSKYTKDSMNVEMKGMPTWDMDPIEGNDHYYLHLKKVGTVHTDD